MNTESSLRKPEHPIVPLFFQRWSPRAFLPEAISDEDLFKLFEAARWAPSSFNNQSWRFLYARRETPEWPLFFDLLLPGNQVWVSNAAALILVISNSCFDYNGKPSVSHSFDAGAAAQNLALQAWSSGYATHAMEGFDYNRAREILCIPLEFRVEAMVAVGKQGSKESLPEKLKAVESPNTRRPISESIAEGKFVDTLLHFIK